MAQSTEPGDQPSCFSHSVPQVCYLSRPGLKDQSSECPRGIYLKASLAPATGLQLVYRILVRILGSHFPSPFIIFSSTGQVSNVSVTASFSSEARVGRRICAQKSSEYNSRQRERCRKKMQHVISGKRRDAEWGKIPAPTGAGKSMWVRGRAWASQGSPDFQHRTLLICFCILECSWGGQAWHALIWVSISVPHGSGTILGVAWTLQHCWA